VQQLIRSLIGSSRGVPDDEIVMWVVAIVLSFGISSSLEGLGLD
jgi:hypothetical protein